MLNPCTPAALPQTLSQDNDRDQRSIETIGIVGDGQMGNGIAHVMALAGYEVRLNDISQDSLDAAMARIAKNMERQVSRDAIRSEERDKALGLISTTLKLPDIGATDLII